MVIYLTGGSGFIGRYLYKNLDYNFRFYSKESKISINSDVVIHLAGKSHDLKNVSNSEIYYEANTDFTKQVFDAFLKSNAKVFITLSSVKAVSDHLNDVLTEEMIPNPTTHYGKSKLLAEQYILSQKIPKDKRIYILRPCMIHGPGNKGNLNLLYRVASKSIPWPLGLFDNARSYLSIDNLCFIIKELIKRDNIPSGIYNVADDDALSTNEVISILAKSKSRQANILKVSKGLILFIAKLGNLFQLPLTTERLQKLTESYVVSNQKIKMALGKSLPISAEDGLLKTFNSFLSDNK